ncbi:MAG: OmpA family protein [Myxococcota bacterium]
MRVLATVVLAATLVGGCVSKSKYAELETQYNTAVADRDAAKADAESTKAELEEVRAKNRKRVENFASVYEELLKVEAAKLAKVKIEDGRAVLQLDSDVLFASGSATLTADGLKTVQEIAKALSGSTAEFQVEGHTDNDPMKNSKEFPTNWHLGADRSINVVLEMVKAGMPADRVSAATFSEFQPVVENTSPDNKKQNRRIEIVWMPELSEMLPYKRMMKEIKDKQASAAEPATPTPTDAAGAGQ